MKKHKMTIRWAVGVLALTIGLCLTACVRAEAGNDPDGTELTQREIEAVREGVEIWKIGGDNVSIEVLFDAKGNPKYLFGLTENGYVILRREDLSFSESGQGNPYSQYPDAKKYYGAPLAYFVEAVDEDGNPALLDVRRGTLVPLA